MKLFTVFLGNRLVRREYAFLKNESYLSRNTKVCRGNEDDLLQHSVFCQLVRILDPRVELLLSHHIKMHHIADIQIVDPVLHILQAKIVPHIELECLIFLNLSQLLM